MEKKSNYSVVNLINYLQFAKCKIAVDKIQYKRIGKKTIQEESLSNKEKNMFAKAIKTASTAGEYTDIMNEYQNIIDSRKKLNFDYENTNCHISKITWDETRANVSMLFKINGKIELSEDKPSELPKYFDTFIYRNYAIIRDGILNIEVLPVIFDEVSFTTLKALGVIENDIQFVDGEIVYLNLSNLPVISDDMTKEVSAQEYFENIHRINNLKARLKVLKYFKDMYFPSEKTLGIVEKYGSEASAYLESIGITDNGFSPKTKVVAGTESVEIEEVIAKIAGMSKIPSVNAVLKKQKDGKKLNGADCVVANWISLCETLREKDGDEEFKNWLDTLTEKTNDDIKTISGILAKARFAIIVGKIWFKEFETRDNCNMTLKLDGVNDFVCSVELKKSTINI